ncbi:hypothetical protein B0H15DRAFT_466224 [Mycena belliarum]|uniref:Uncharacterized protein n=1 Tax=Mycena belliarum TaxID=1033014 RepID=A0AAD6XQS9_9AGAR|nr:hypothetical protein B0H15DRAFT_466224 [Mycena belliae]
MIEMSCKSKILNPLCGGEELGGNDYIQHTTMARGRRYLWIFACGLLVIGLLGLRTGSILNHEPEVQSPSALHVVPAAGQRAVQKSLVPLKRRVYLRVADSGKEGIGVHTLPQPQAHPLIFCVNLVHAAPLQAEHCSRARARRVAHPCAEQKLRVFDVGYLERPRRYSCRRASGLPDPRPCQQGGSGQACTRMVWRQ